MLIILMHFGLIRDHFTAPVAFLKSILSRYLSGRETFFTSNGRLFILVLSKTAMYGKTIKALCCFIISHSN